IGRVHDAEAAPVHVEPRAEPAEQRDEEGRDGETRLPATRVPDAARVRRCRRRAAVRDAGARRALVATRDADRMLAARGVLGDGGVAGGAAVGRRRRDGNMAAARDPALLLRMHPDAGGVATAGAGRGSYVQLTDRAAVPLGVDLLLLGGRGSAGRIVGVVHARL